MTREQWRDLACLRDRDIQAGPGNCAKPVGTEGGKPSQAIHLSRPYHPPTALSTLAKSSALTWAWPSLLLGCSTSNLALNFLPLWSLTEARRTSSNMNWTMSSSDETLQMFSLGPWMLLIQSLLAASPGSFPSPRWSQLRHTGLPSLPWAFHAHPCHRAFVHSVLSKCPSPLSLLY